MARLRCLWDLENDPDGNVVHIADHGLTTQDVEDVLEDPLGEERSESSGRPIAFGWTRSGMLVAVVFDWVEDELVYPVTAFRIDG